MAYPPDDGNNLASPEKQASVNTNEPKPDINDSIGKPVSRSENPHAPVLEHDAHGNEIYYRTMSERHYNRLERSDPPQLPATGETFISSDQADASGYDGVLVRLAVKPSTTEKLMRMGRRSNGLDQTNMDIYKDMPPANTGWNTKNAQYKLEGTGKPNVNDGQGVVNTGLGKGDALKTFNENIVDFEKLD